MKTSVVVAALSSFLMVPACAQDVDSCTYTSEFHPAHSSYAYRLNVHSDGTDASLALIQIEKSSKKVVSSQRKAISPSSVDLFCEEQASISRAAQRRGEVEQVTIDGSEPRIEIVRPDEKTYFAPDSDGYIEKSGEIDQSITDFLKRHGVTLAPYAADRK
ncbi:hypothetical protein [Novosphingobium sp. MBES04]|uniref:hypothetical protein n=1 Tax=Novosphingobium sp. MBES04 TaxID=1206458 RepID=UPI00057D29F0|nr:hypothetical protein [Novosphingobium sp. MBES04]